MDIPNIAQQHGSELFWYTSCGLFLIAGYIWNKREKNIEDATKAIEAINTRLVADKKDLERQITEVTAKASASLTEAKAMIQASIAKAKAEASKCNNDVKTELLKKLTEIESDCDTTCEERINQVYNHLENIRSARNVEISNLNQRLSTLEGEHRNQHGGQHVQV